ncbi:MAG: hypothetical protein FWH01_16295, partial [Oscillospiraceae bacterium]|nr:hypothetical protein [Oscillospiraceae bacterium]
MAVLFDRAKKTFFIIYSAVFFIATLAPAAMAPFEPRIIGEVGEVGEDGEVGEVDALGESDVAGELDEVGGFG